MNGIKSPSFGNYTRYGGDYKNTRDDTIQSQPILTLEKTLVSIDSCDRNMALYPNPSEYNYKLRSPFKNVVSIRLMSLEVPTSFYIFSSSASNISFKIKEGSGQFVTVTIPDGNYNLVDLCQKIQDTLATLKTSSALNQTYSVSLNINTLRVSITNTNNSSFTIDFASYTVHKPTFWGIGYFLGFSNEILTSSSTGLTGTKNANINPYNYMILDLGDLNMIQEGDKVKGYFAKIPINVDMFNYVYLTPECCTYNISQFEPPIGKLETIRIKWRFHDGRIIDFNNYDHSFMIEIITGEGKLKNPQINLF